MLSIGKKRSMLDLEENMIIQRDHKLIHDYSIPEPFDLNKQLSSIKLRRHHRKRETVTMSRSPKRYVLFAIDTSGSIGEQNFTKIVNIVSEFVPYFCHETNFAVMTFGSTVYREICFNCNQNLIKVSQAIKTIKYRGGGTRTGEAAICACDYMFSLKCFSGNIRTLFSSIIDVVFITDGYSNGPFNVCEEAEDCFGKDKFKNINVFAFGIGSRINQTELECIIKPRKDENSMFNFLDLGKFENFKNQAIRQLGTENYTCSEF